ncbi:hypothetical protein RIF29_21355 [Crotalaria pallida]|uniref:Uncharacterized protein n=1 Tax=Crotalaria pallida TaxID=3830 RepID=A0AAN9F7A1_CROPI
MKHVQSHDGGKEVAVGNGSRFDVLSQQQEDLVNTNVGPTSSFKKENKGKRPADYRVRNGPKHGPSRIAGHNKETKPRNGNASSKLIRGQKDQVVSPKITSTVAKNSELGNNGESSSGGDKEELKRKEKEILAAMSGKQNEMWKQFKEGKNVDDFLGCASVYYAHKELEFLKQQSARNKEGWLCFLL